MALLIDKLIFCVRGRVDKKVLKKQIQIQNQKGFNLLLLIWC